MFTTACMSPQSTPSSSMTSLVSIEMEIPERQIEFTNPPQQNIITPRTQEEQTIWLKTRLEQQATEIVSLKRIIWDLKTPKSLKEASQSPTKCNEEEALNEQRRYQELFAESRMINLRKIYELHTQISRLTETNMLLGDELIQEKEKYKLSIKNKEDEIEILKKQIETFKKASVCTFIFNRNSLEHVQSDEIISPIMDQLTITDNVIPDEKEKL